MLTHDAVADRKAQACALADRLRRVERVEDPVDGTGGDAGSGIGDRGDEHPAAARGPQENALLTRPAVESLLGIRQNVEEYLLELKPVGPRRRKRLIQLEIDLDLLYAESVAAQLESVEQQLIQVRIATLRRMLSRKGEEVRDDA